VIHLDANYLIWARTRFHGRKRTARYDCMIAAAAIQAGARLATSNTVDYRTFAAQGLQLA
jgi:predicted nucleic acid-binding protein